MVRALKRAPRAYHLSLLVWSSLGVDYIRLVSAWGYWVAEQHSTTATSVLPTFVQSYARNPNESMSISTLD